MAAKTHNQSIINIQLVLTAIENIDNYSHEQLRQLVEPIWKNLEKYNDWTSLDLYLVNNILYFFDTISAQNIAKQAIKMIDQNYPHLLALKASLLLNAAHLAILSDQKTLAIQLLQDSLQITPNIHRYDLILVAKLRIAMLRNNLQQAIHYHHLLQAMGDEQMAVGMEAEFPALKQ